MHRTMIKHRRITLPAALLVIFLIQLASCLSLANNHAVDTKSANEYKEADSTDSNQLSIAETQKHDDEKQNANKTDETQKVVIAKADANNTSPSISPEIKTESKGSNHDIWATAALAAAPIIILLATILLVIRKKNKKQKEEEERKQEGVKSENKRNFISTLTNEYESHGFKVLSGLRISDSSKKEIEIDALMMCDTVIFTFGYNDYSGSVFGNAKKKYWKRCRLRNKRKFYNPIRQNEIRITALKKFLGDPGVPVVSVIIFSNRCDRIEIANTYDINADVIQEKNLTHALNKIIRKFKPAKADDNSGRAADEICAKLINCQKTSN